MPWVACSVQCHYSNSSCPSPTSSTVVILALDDVLSILGCPSYCPPLVFSCFPFFYLSSSFWMMPLGSSCASCSVQHIVLLFKLVMFISHLHCLFVAHITLSLPCTSSPTCHPCSGLCPCYPLVPLLIAPNTMGTFSPIHHLCCLQDLLWDQLHTMPCHSTQINGLSKLISDHSFKREHFHHTRFLHARNQAHHLKHADQHCTAEVQYKYFSFFSIYSVIMFMLTVMAAEDQDLVNKMEDQGINFNNIIPESEISGMVESDLDADEENGFENLAKGFSEWYVPPYHP